MIQIKKSLIIIYKVLKSIGAGATCSGLIGAGVGLGWIVCVCFYIFNLKLNVELFEYINLGFILKIIDNSNNAAYFFVPFIIHIYIFKSLCSNLYFSFIKNQFLYLWWLLINFVILYFIFIVILCYYNASGKKITEKEHLEILKKSPFRWQWILYKIFRFFEFIFLITGITLIFRIILWIFRIKFIRIMVLLILKIGIALCIICGLIYLLLFGWEGWW